jgi:hypothetical protein
MELAWVRVRARFVLAVLTLHSALAETYFNEKSLFRPENKLTAYELTYELF